ncbi:hypothetical protein R3P38DRAFT_3264979 [Favolaschia claudopus]|uniref:Uncharacterized protein n=1 Tax=Favolaschia claudopus TaxID=2862362 RepID=A0AAW0C162_9AGAR
MNCIPRFTNPHSIRNTVECVARSQLFDSPPTDEHDPELQSAFTELIQSTLQVDRPKKRRKLNPPATEGDDEPETSVSFRLLSTTQTISLLPPPAPPPVTREPEYEDTESVAKTRRQWAATVAVDAAWVVRESQRIPPPFRVGRVQHVKTDDLLGSPPPPMMRACCLQPPRKTRPPVPRSELQHHPYVPLPVLPSPDATGFLPCVNVAMVDKGLRKPRRRRRRDKELKTRPRATFWRSSLSFGKSLGYAMGY